MNVAGTAALVFVAVIWRRGTGALRRLRGGHASFDSAEVRLAAPQPSAEEERIRLRWLSRAYAAWLVSVVLGLGFSSWGLWRVAAGKSFSVSSFLSLLNGLGGIGLHVPARRMAMDLKAWGQPLADKEKGAPNQGPQ
jgi:hypothetical protein